MKMQNLICLLIDTKVSSITLSLYSEHPMYYVAVLVAKQRETIYAEMANSEDSVIVLPKYRFSTHGNFVDENSWEHQIFKVYYDIEHKQVIFK